MRLRYITIIVFSALMLSCDSHENESRTQGNGQNQPVFTELTAENTGLSFVNSLTPNLETLENLFDFDYYYNGSGVAIGDLNNDGLQDIVFASNQSTNALYLNEGNLSFKDITAGSGINKGKKWSNGVTLLDINKDGYLDIYITQGGPYPEAQRANLLYINQGNLTFKEAAVAYGLADQGMGTQSAFIDFDNDGDLDCIVMNEAELYGYNVEQFLQKAYSNKQTLYYNSSHLYENQNGKFVDITESANLLTPSFGLGLLVTDINNDGLADIYMANDYFLPDRLFINKGNLRFSEEHKLRSNQMSFFGMGVDAGDINNDGHEDIFVLDMASSDHYRSKTLMASMDTEQFDLMSKQLEFGYQYMFNSLLLSDTKGRYNNIAHMSGVALTDWSWAGLIEDYDLDGFRDIFVTNGYRKYGTDNDFKSKVRKAKLKYKGAVPLNIKEELYQEMPEEMMANVLFLNNKELGFTNTTSDISGINKLSFSNGAATGDLDNDGDLDLVINNIDSKATLLRNNSNESKSSWLTIKLGLDLQDKLPLVTIYSGDKTWVQRVKRVRGYMSACQPLAHFGLGNTSNIDSIKIECGGRQKLLNKVAINSIIDVDVLDDNYAENQQNRPVAFEKKSISTLKFFARHKENIYNDFLSEILLPYKQGTNGPTMSVLSKDENPQLFFSSGLGSGSTLFDIDNGELNRNESLKTLLTGEITAIETADLNKDGKIDYIIGTGDNSQNENSEIYQNYILLSEKGSYVKEIIPGLASTGDIAVADFDGDGYEEIIIGNRIVPHKYPLAAASQYFQNDKGRILLDESKSKALAELGIVNDLLVTDYNNDGLPDVVVAAEWEPLRILVNKDGELNSQPLTNDNLSGWWFSLQEIDVNNDGHLDIVAGNLGSNSKYSASTSKPLKIFADDFDNSGSLDIVLSKKYKDAFVPFRGKECSSQQMPFVSDKFKTYDQFASATLEDVYGSMENRYQKECNEFRHVVLINDGKGSYQHYFLPATAQISPILDMVKLDLNEDGYDDLITVGNIFSTEAETPRLDFNSVIILMSDKNQNFKAILGSELGITLNGEAKSLELIEKDKVKYLLVGINDKAPEIFSVNTFSF